jgi:cytochrome c-type biogenesis protein CcmH/NrfG
MPLMLAVLLVLSPPRSFAQSAPTGAQADSLYRIALQRIDDGDPAGAIAELRRVIAEDPRRPQAYCHLGHLLFDQQDIDSAEKAFRRALELDGDLADAYYGLGRVCRKRPKGRVRAIQQFRSALARDPRHIEALYELAMTQLELDDYDAKGSFEDLIRQDPEHPDAHYELGRWFEKSRRLEDASRSYAQQVRVNPGHPLAQRALRNVYRKIRSARRLGDLEVVFQIRDDTGSNGDGDGRARVLPGGGRFRLDYRIYHLGSHPAGSPYRVTATLEEDPRRGPGRSLAAVLARMVGSRRDVFLIPFDLAGIRPVDSGSLDLGVSGVPPGERRLVVRVLDARGVTAVERDEVLEVR